MSYSYSRIKQQRKDEVDQHLFSMGFTEALFSEYRSGGNAWAA
jgi:hypothetical protein